MAASHSAAFARDGFEYRFNAETIYDTNPLTRSDDISIDEIWGARTSGALIFKHEGAKELFQSDLTLTRNQFNESEFNSSDVSLTVRAQKQIKRWFLEITGRGLRDTTRVSANDVLGQSDVIIGDRTRFSVSPSVVYAYSARNSIGVNLDWQDQRYDEGTGLVDHRTYSVSPFVSRKLTPLQTLSLALLYQNYESQDGSDVEVESIGPFVTWEYDFVRNLSFNASVGFLRTEFEGVTTDNGSETNPIYSLELAHDGQKSDTFLQLERSRQGLADGSEIDLTSVRFGYNYDVTPRWGLNFRAQYRDAEQSGFSTQNLDSSYEGTLGTSYDISRQLKLSASYRYVRNSFSNDNDDAARNIMRAGIEYSLY